MPEHFAFSRQPTGHQMTCLTHNADGLPDLWVRDTANGTVSEYGGRDRAGGSALKAPVLYAQF